MPTGASRTRPPKAANENTEEEGPRRRILASVFRCALLDTRAQRLRSPQSSAGTSACSLVLPIATGAVLLTLRAEIGRLAMFLIYENTRLQQPSKDATGQ